MIYRKFCLDTNNFGQWCNICTMKKITLKWSETKFAMCILLWSVLLTFVIIVSQILVGNDMMPGNEPKMFQCQWSNPEKYELMIRTKKLAVGWYHVAHYIKSLWPRDAIWPHRSESTLAQAMACCLTAPSHYLNQCWLIISEVHQHCYLNQFWLLINGVLWYSLERICASSGHVIMLYNEFEIIHFRLLPYLPGANDLIHDIIHGTSVTA